MPGVMSGADIAGSAEQERKCVFEIGGRSRNRTGVHGVAVRCITTLPSGLQDLGHFDVRLLLSAIHNNRIRQFGAGNETRTRDPDLGKVVLYQLSYSRFA